MNLIIFTNGTFEDQKALYNKDKEEVIVIGDSYHDKIDEYIDGIIYGIDYCGVDTNVEVERIYPDNKFFNKCNFVNESY